MSLLATTAVVFAQPRDDRLPSPLAHPERMTGAAWLAAGDAALRAGDLNAALDAYRAAGEHASSRARAAALLHELHRRRDFRLEPDESLVRETLAALGPEFRRTETAHFVVLSDADAAWTRARARLLEDARRQFYRAADRLGLDPLPHAHKLLCVLFADHERYLAFARAQDGLRADWVAGYYSPRANRVVFFDDRDSPEVRDALATLEGYQARADDARARADDARGADSRAADRLLASADALQSRIDAERARLHDAAAAISAAKTIHEAVHLLAFNAGVQTRHGEYPFWVSEGLAVAFEPDDPSRPFGPDRENPARAAEFRRLVETGRVMPVAELVVLRAVPDHDAPTADVMYTQSWALFSFLHRRDRAALGRYLVALRERLPREALSDQDHLDLFRRHFGDPRTLDALLVRHAAARPQG